MTISFWLVFPQRPPRRRGIIAVRILQHNPIAPADPAAFRVGTPYFNYQLKPNPTIATSANCAGI